MGIVKESQQGLVKYLTLATAWTHSRIMKGHEEGQVTQIPAGVNSQVM